MTHPADQPLDVVAVTQDHTVRISIRGEADIATIAQLRNTLAQVGLDAVRQVHVDLSEFTFCDAQSMRELASFVDHARQTGHGISVHNTRPVVRRLSTLMRLDQNLYS
jgi:anti-anti-sigma factor